VDSINKIKETYGQNTNFKRSLEKYHFDHTDSTFYAFADTITHENFKDWNIEHYLPKIEAPILVIQGELDEYGTEKQVESIYQKGANADNQKHILAGCGHSPHLSHAIITTKLMGEFL
jgi:pimeloyl-ACP methyl ester carboxylesterase